MRRATEITKHPNSNLLFSLVAVILLLAACSSPNYSISGTIKSGGAPIQGVTVTLAGNDSRVTTTDVNGNYSFFNMANGDYTLTPSLGGYTFTPTIRYVYLGGADANGFNFSTSVESRIATTTHTVYLKADTTAWAWGKNTNGQLGVGDTVDRTIPTASSGLFNMSAVAAGNDHTIALMLGGSVWSWGKNTDGQLGDGTTTDSSIRGW